MRTSEQLLADILTATTDAARLVDVGHHRFVTDPLLIRAAKNIISEIGEAAKGLDDTVLATIPGVPWKAVKGMRDKVVHDYPELDLDLLWDTLVHGLPVLHRAIVERDRS
ncbi:MAG: DUF86 domain-containing protein [Actinomycetota bacterium]|nr:DUF86 domain-containing protein [Actinomycetota bacterium]